MEEKDRRYPEGRRVFHQGKGRLPLFSASSTSSRPMHIVKAVYEAGFKNRIRLAKMAARRQASGNGRTR